MSKTRGERGRANNQWKGYDSSLIHEMSEYAWNYLQLRRDSGKMSAQWRRYFWATALASSVPHSADRHRMCIGTETTNISTIRRRTTFASRRIRWPLKFDASKLVIKGLGPAKSGITRDTFGAILRSRSSVSRLLFCTRHAACVWHVLNAAWKIRLLFWATFWR